MKRFALACIIGVCFVSPMTSSQSAAQERVVSKASATVTSVPGQPQVVVHITNLSNTAIDAWQVRLIYDLGSGDATTLNVTSDAGLSLPDQPDQGPIRPGTSRDEIYALASIPRSVVVTLQMVLFADMSSEGSQEVASSVLQKREQRANNLALWIEALQSASTKSPQQARTALQHTLASDPRFVVDPTDSWAIGMRENITQLISTLDGSAASLAKIRAAKGRFEMQRDRALRHKAR